MKFIRTPFKYTYRNYVLKLIVINFAVYIALALLDTIGLTQVKDSLALVPVVTIRKHWYWQVFTYQFLHGDMWHIFFNMLALLFIGQSVEKKMGSKEFLLYYLVSGTITGIVACAGYYVYFLQTGRIIALIGASGTVFAVLFAFAVLYPDRIIYIWGIIPIPSPLFIAIYGAFELYYAFFSSGNVAHLVHITGLLVGWLYIRIRYGIKPLKVWFNRRN